MAICFWRCKRLQLFLVFCYTTNFPLFLFYSKLSFYSKSCFKSIESYKISHCALEEDCVWSMMPCSTMCSILSWWSLKTQVFKNSIRFELSKFKSQFWICTRWQVEWSIAVLIWFNSSTLSWRGTNRSNRNTYQPTQLSQLSIPRDKQKTT